jgi:hypothetical protein
MIENKGSKFANFKEFYPFYLSQHTDIHCRRLHVIGSFLVIIFLLLGIFTAHKIYLIAIPIAGYGCAWSGHFLFEKNKPATFTYPIYSLMGDWLMFWEILTGKLSLIRH